MVMLFEQSHLDGKRGQRGNQARPAQVLLDGRYVTYAQARGRWPVTLEVLR